MSEVSVPRPDLTPERKPQAIDRDPGKRTNQLLAIAEKPSSVQLKTIQAALERDGKSGQDAVKEAPNYLSNFKTLVEEKMVAEKASYGARSAALGAARDQWASKREAYKEVVSRRDALRRAVRESGSWFAKTGLQIEAGQRPLTASEKASKRTAEVGYEAARVASRVQEQVTVSAETVSKGFKSAVESAGNSVKSVVETGNKGINGVVSTGRESFNTARRALANKVGEVVGGVGRGVVREAQKAVDKVGDAVSDSWEASSVWVKTMAGKTGDRLVLAGLDATGRVDKATGVVSSRVSEFNQAMESAGGAAKEKWGKATEGVMAFATRQAERVQSLQKSVLRRVSLRVTQTLERTQVRLAPAKEAIESERQNLRDNTRVLTEKVGLIVESVTDVATPYVDRVMDQGRDIRDSAMGYSSAAIEGLRAHGRSLAGSSRERVNGVMDSIGERCESMRLRSNEARGRLNAIVGEKLESTGNKFNTLKESLTGRAERAVGVVSGGVEAALEYVKKTGEKLEGTIEGVRRYFEIYAVGKWQEMGMSSKDISPRLKLMRAQVAASAIRAATVSAAVGVEGAALAQRFARDPKGRLLIGAASLAIGLTSCPEIGNFLQGVGENFNLSALGNLPDFSAGVPDVSAATMPDIPAATMPDIPASVDNVGVVDGGLGVGLESSVPPSGAGGVELVAGTAVEVTTPIETLDQIAPGQPLEAQARRIAEEAGGNSTEAFYDIMRDSFFKNESNFRTTADAIINGNYSPLEKVVAQNQLNAINALRANANIDPSSPLGTQLLRQATHFWRP